HQLGRGQQIEIEILLDDRGAVRRKGEGFWANLRGHVGKLDLADARWNGDLPHVLNKREIIVIDGDGYIALRRSTRRIGRGRLREGGGRQSEQQGGKQTNGVHQDRFPPRRLIRSASLRPICKAHKKRGWPEIRHPLFFW